MPNRLAAVAALALAAALASCTPTTTPATTTTTTAQHAEGPAADTTTGAGTPLSDAINSIPTAAEHRTGYTRDAFHLWIDADHNGCNTRQEVLIAQAVTAPTVGPRCSLTGGSWRSYYDDTTVTSAHQLDIDHVVPLAEAWDSGAWTWTADRRERYANDLAGGRSLIAVTAHANRSKGDDDPAEWMPPAADAQCTYAADWVRMKLRWNLTADTAEKTALARIAASCSTTTVAYTPAS
ncbi:HNH endonuclease family protein [Streptomyces sp. NBC_00669]|uniref:HNH endonuclease family protein n=1 Tax=Streptomyces sp. NBC_00669 TaxID=2976011 RepID=UPI002E375382|nr:HNH endonuclease family protein [Streptomyces sp. NBC_00669]